MRKWVRSLVVVAVSFALSLAAGWIYLTWDVDAPDEGAWIAPPLDADAELDLSYDPWPIQKEVLLEEIDALAAQIREYEQPIPLELTEKAREKTRELLSIPHVTAHTIGTLPWPDDWVIKCLPPVPFGDGELTFFSYTLLRDSDAPTGLLKYQSGETVSTTVCGGYTEALRAVEVDGILYAVAIGTLSPDAAEYSAGIFGLEDNDLSFFETLDTGISRDTYYHSLSAEIVDGILTSYNASRPQWGESRLVKKDGVLRFEYWPANATTALPEDYSAYGLLLGLSDDRGNVRTLWVRPAGGRLRIGEISNAVVFPYGEGFSWLKNVRHTYEKANVEDEESVSSFFLSKLLLAPLGEDPFPLIEDLTGDDPEWGRSSESEDRLYYVGEQYICYGNRYYYDSGVKFYYGSENVRLVPLEAVNRMILNDPFPEEGIDGYPQLERLKLYDLIDNGALSTLGIWSKFNFGYGGNEYLSLNDLALIHKFGRWNLSAPVFSFTHSPRSGSTTVNLVKFLPLGEELPESLTGVENLPDGVEVYMLQENFQANDAVAPPDLKSVIAIGDEGIIVCDSNLNKLLSVSSSPGERIVSIRWAGANDLPQWEETFAPFLNKN